MIVTAKKILSIFIFVKLCEALICYECNNAPTEQECRRKGKIRLCGKNQKACQTTRRIDFTFGSRVKISKRCKQARACQNNFLQNDAENRSQCNHFKHLSVCRCCCITDLCNYDTDTCTGVKEPALLTEQPIACEPLPELQNGDLACDNENLPGSTCYFRCNEFYDLRGPGRIRCHAEGLKASWSEKLPCCSKPCPPHGNMDLIFGVDSSLELNEDWIKVKELIRGIIRSFIVGPTDSRIGVVTYNEKIDVAREIYLSSYNTTNSLAEAVKLLSRHPGPAKGTRIGQLLEHVNRVSLTTKRGNRPEVRDILIVLTAGPPLKERLKPEITAKLLRDNGIDVITVGVGRYVDVEQLRGTAGVKKKVVEIPGGIDKIGESTFQQKIINLICGATCPML